MKKILNILIASILLISCQSEKVKIELNLTKGEIYKQKMIADMTIEESFNGMPLNINTKLTGSMSFKVIDIKDVMYDMEVRYESLAMKMSLPMGTQEFNSDKKDNKDLVSTILGAMINKPFNIKMTKTGKVIEVKNIDSLFIKVFDLFPKVPEEQKEQVISQITQSYGEKAFKGNIEMAMAFFSDNPVSRGDKWTVETILENKMMPSIIESTYELKKTGDVYYLITGNSKIVTDNNADSIQTNGMSSSYDMKGTMTSEIKVNKKTGWIIEAKLNQEIKGTVQIKDNPKMPGGMSIPMTIKNNMTISEK